MSKRKPKIAVTGPDKGGTSAWLFTRLAVWLQGGKAVRITPSNPQRGIELDALILGGGADINPERYGQSLLDDLPGKNRPKPRGSRQWFFRIISFLIFPILFLIRKLFSTKSPTLDEARDEIEVELLEYALKKGIPILGICRGAQLINVHFGGNLHQDIDTFYREIPKVNTIWPEKKVEIKNGSRLEGVLKTTGLWVNALHHQAVDRIGDSLEVVAREATGIAQAIENPQHEFLIGVQWHPEYMPQIPRQRALFKALVKSAKQGIGK
ncbi:type 1 glutamine amidotransferase [Balneolaceae bacterium YR4-1]|uniref:Type 1 glutamine amidotransferase n=1 Tax=Halalkalibaculum roseum TaxID=2709311 RepID=A0A6M1SY02_9BACT|nr:type 1 glutamine amidotransferase [Halalkalibaculum roseum]NGP76024.1 type 1 glutamine amidotransferase [Halalkalibaculum roseum]